MQLTQAARSREIETLAKLRLDPYKQIWDFGYISSSDDEDDEDDESSSSSDSDSDSEEETKTRKDKKSKKTKEVKPDVVDLLIEKDKVLL